MERHEVQIGQRVRHRLRKFTGLVVHAQDPYGVPLFGIKVDEQYITRAATNTNYYHGCYWAAAFNLEPEDEKQSVYYLVSTIFCQEVSQ